MALQQQLRLGEVTIANGQSISAAFEAVGHTIKRILLPGVLAGAKLRILHGLSEGGTFHAVRDTSGDPIAFPFTAGDSIELTRELCDGSAWIKLQTVAGDGTTAATQSGDRTISLVAIP